MLAFEPRKPQWRNYVPQAAQQVASTKTVYLSDYRPPGFLIERIALTLRLAGDADGATQVNSRLSVRRAPGASVDAPLRLDGRALQLVGLRLNGRVLDAAAYRQDDRSLTLLRVPDRFTLEIDTHINPTTNTSLKKLYLTNNTYLTQYKTKNFHKITYYPNKPNIITHFTTHIKTNTHTYPILLSNNNYITIKPLPEKQHFTI